MSLLVEQGFDRGEGVVAEAAVDGVPVLEVGEADAPVLVNVNNQRLNRWEGREELT